MRHILLLCDASTRLLSTCLDVPPLRVCPSAGSGHSPVCPQEVEDKGTVCKKSHKPCVLDAKCDGVQPYCPAPKDAKTGTPCTKDGHSYEEAYDDESKMSLMDESSAEALAKKHGWEKCNRCKDGECVAFEYKWWEKKSKHHKHKDDDEEEEEEYYDTKSDKGKGKAESTEPAFYCKKYEY